MTEREKMLSGEFYDIRNAEIRATSNRGRDLCRIYNNLPSENVELRNQIISILFGACGENTRVNQPIHIDYGCHIFIGKNTIVNINCTFLDTGKITIGDNVLIAPDVKIYTALHPVSADERIYTDESGLTYRTKTAPVTIGNNVWIGGGTVILPGVTIGDNAVIGAGSVVTKSIPANVVACGNPCTVKKITNEYDADRNT